VLDVLVVLVRHRDRVVTREELLDAVWPGVSVGPSSVSRAIKEVRRAIGDEAQSLIRTVHGIGFRFVANVEAAGAVAPPPAPVPSTPPGRSSELAAILGALSVACQGRVVVRVRPRRAGHRQDAPARGVCRARGASGAQGSSGAGCRMPTPARRSARGARSAKSSAFARHGRRGRQRGREPRWRARALVDALRGRLPGAP
jgi:hypothetical protein